MSASPRRLFFAFWPDATSRAALEAARGRLFPLSGRPVEPDNLHVTAAFLGAVPEERLASLQSLCGVVTPFTLRLDRLEHWPKSRVLVAGASQVPDELRRVVDTLWQRLDRLGFAREPRPLRPHVTLARDVRTLRPGLAWTPVAWKVSHLELVQSHPGASGVTYQRLPEPALR